jgi:hypothetical protein
MLRCVCVRERERRERGPQTRERVERESARARERERERAGETCVSTRVNEQWGARVLAMKHMLHTFVFERLIPQQPEL